MHAQSNLKPATVLKSRRLMLLSTNMGVGGGAEEQVIHLAYGFAERGWKPMIVSMLPPSPMPADFASHGIPLVDLGMRKGVPNPKSLYKLSKLIREFQPDVVHSHMTHANLLARAVRLIQPYPVLICTLHALTMAGVQRDHTAVLEVAHRLTDALADRTTAICHAASEYYIRRRAVPASKMMVVHNGIDSTRFAANADARQRLRSELGLGDSFVWLAAGRLELVKAYPTLLRAFARLQGDTQRLLICGTGSLKDQLVALAVELGIADRVKFLGLRNDVPDVMSAADAFALSSDSEGLPLVLLQASAAGLPIVATNVGGNSEAVVKKVNGLLVPPGDPWLFAQAMQQVENSPVDHRASMGRAGRERVQALFETSSVVSRWESLYTELLSRAGNHL